MYICVSKLTRNNNGNLRKYTKRHANCTKFVRPSYMLYDM